MIAITENDVILMGPMVSFSKFVEKHNRAVKCRITNVMEHPNGQKILDFTIEEEDRKDWVDALSGIRSGE